MEEERNMPHKKHVFVCVNERDNGSYCKNVGGFEAFMELKKFVRDRNLVKDIWVTRTGCMGFCNDVGCTIAVYPENVWFQQTTKDDLERVKEYLISNI